MDGSRKKVIEAEQIFLLMRENFRVSRNARASWYFRHINECIDSEHLALKKEQGSDEEFQVVSLLPQCSDDDGPSTDCCYKVTSNTVVTFLAKHYRLVFVLDVSPSVASIDLTSERILFGENYRSLHTMLYALTKPCEIPGSSEMFTPSLHITILAHSPLINCFSNTVLIQGVVLTEDNIHCVLDQVRRGLDKFEQRVIDTIAPLVDHYDQHQEEEDGILMSGLFDEIERPKSPEVSQQLITPELSLVNMLKYGILAMQLLPGYSTPGIVVITDGVLGLPDVSLFESVMTQLRHNTISCSFVLTARDSPQSGNLGRVPHTELLQFIATATFGAYFSKMPELDFLDEITGEMNVIHCALLTWSFHRALEGFKIDDYSHPELYENTEGLVSSVSRMQNSILMDQIVNQPFLKTKHTDRNLHTHISNLVSCRLREGYTLKEVNLLKGESQIEVKLVMPWRDFAHIQYIVTSTWPLNTAKRHSHVEIHVEACYEFLHDVNCIQKTPPTSPYRNALIKKYREVLQGMSETDKLLVHLQSFTCSSVHYSIPESLRQKVPLFYLQTHSSTPRLNVQLNTKDSNIELFALFWRPVLMLDVNIWQKWMHAHRIGLLLEHDMPLLKHLQIPNSSGNFHIVWCRVAQLKIGEFLKQFCTFMLMENHSYIKFVFDEPEKTPSTFYIIRVSSKPPCLVLRLAFLGGTPGKTRHQIVTDLEDKLSKLQMSQRGTQTEEHQLEEPTPPLQRTVVPCCIVTKKPVERLLIRYDRAPRDYNTMGCEKSLSSTSNSPYSSSKVTKGSFFTLSRYLHHRRWIYSVQHGSSMPISTQAIGRILSSLTKVRLQQGFHFGQTNSGIINMVLEVDMKTPEDTEDCVSSVSGPCVLQYIIFPPYTTTSVRDNSVSSEEFLEENMETDGDLQVITECWVEPQCGEVVNSTPQRKDFDGLTYSELPHVMYPTDLECISTMITFEHLNLMCHSLSIPSPAVLSHQYNSQPPLSPCMGPPLSPDGTTDIQYVPFPFDLLRVLPKCQQVELLFSTLKQDMVSVLHHISHLSDSTRSDEGLRTYSKNYHGYRSTVQASTPNSLLFKNFMEYLVHIHDREIQLTECQSQQLVPLIQQRDRQVELHPYPFDVEEEEALSEEVIREVDVDIEDTQGISRRGSCRSLLTNYSGSSTTVQSQVPSLQSSQSQTLLQSTSQSPLGLPNAPSFIRTTPAGTQYEGVGDTKPMLGQIGKTISSGSENRSMYSQSGYSTTSNKIANLSFANIESKLESLAPQVSNILTSQASQRPFSPLEDGKSSGVGTPRPEDLSSSLDQQGGNSTIKGSPKWRCFIKSITSTHMMICFVPATYDDLLLLSYEKENVGKLIAYARQSSSERKVPSQEEGFEKGLSMDKTVGEKIMIKKEQMDQHVGENKGNAEQTDGKAAGINADSSGAVKPVESERSGDECVKKQQEGDSVSDSGQNKDPKSVKKSETEGSGESPLERSNVDGIEHVGEDENKENIDPKKKEQKEKDQEPIGVRSSLLLPVYVYNCPLSYLTEQIVNKWTYKKPADIFEDLHFVNEEHVDPEELLEDARDARKCPRKTLSECEKWHLGTPEKVTDDIYANQVDLKQHCTLVSETFFRSFVKSVFTSLQDGHSVDSNDVESAISSICEETIPVETNITEFLLKSCGHTRQIIERATMTHMYHEDLRTSFPGLVVNSKQTEEGSLVQSNTNKEDLGSSRPLPLHVRFPLALLNNKTSNVLCEESQGLHSNIKKNIQDILHMYFTAVPSSPEYLFYCPPDNRLDEDNQTEQADNSEALTNMDETSLDEASQALHDMIEQNDIDYEDCEVLNYDQGKFQPDLSQPYASLSEDPRLSVMSNKSLSGHSSLEEAFEELGELAAHKSMPLFLQLVCSVCVKSRLLKSLPVRELPTCLGELRECLEGLSEEVDLSEVRVTLDVICLTLPPEVDLSDSSTKRPCYNRLTSHLSCASSVDEDDIISHPTTTDYGLNTESGSDPLKSLPTDQHTAILQCLERTRWFLQDEIASASRSMHPVTSEVLDTVTKHVKNSIAHAQCLHEEVPLQFVFGTEQTLMLFVQDFQKMHLPGYHLNKEGLYYYLYMDRAQASFQALGNALSSRLVHINDRDPVTEMAEGEGALKCPHLSDSLTSDSRERSRFPTGEKGEPAQDFSALTSTPQRSDITASDVSSPVKSVHVSKGSEESQSSVKQVLAELDESVVSTPSSPERQLVRQKAVDHRPELVNRDSQLSDISVFESEPAENSEKGKLPVDDSIEVLAKDSDLTKMKDLENETGSSQQMQAGAIFRGDNIRISVTRPSPVREFPAENIQVDQEDSPAHVTNSETGAGLWAESSDMSVQVVSKVDGLVMKDGIEDRSRHSTGSSIQVISQVDGMAKEMVEDRSRHSTSSSSQVDGMVKEVVEDRSRHSTGSSIQVVSQVEGMVKEMVEDRSRHSTGSSIQVIEEHEEEDDEEEDFLEANLNEAIRENRDMNQMMGSTDSSQYGSERGEDGVMIMYSGKLDTLDQDAPPDREDEKLVLSYHGNKATASLLESATKKNVDRETEGTNVKKTDFKENISGTSSSKDRPRVLQSASCDFAVSMMTMPQPIRNVGALVSDEFQRPGQLPDNKVDAFVKTVHFLKHQSPDTNGMDSRALAKNIASLKASQAAEQTLNTSVSSINVQFSDQTLPAAKPSPCAAFSSPPEPERKPTIKRAHSSACIEKYKTDQDRSQPSIVGRRSSQSGRVTPSRSRHHSGQSGPRTPLSSVFDLSSRGSYGEEGYEGDSSDTEEEENSLSSSDAIIQRHRLPDFWLILKIGKDFVDVFYHSRAGQKQPDIQLYNQVVKNIKRICHVVNQKLLLEDLYSTRICNSLLVPEADEDIKWWKQDKIFMPRKKLERSDSDDSDDADGAQHYLAASMHITEGHFACEMVWSNSFTLHPRLRSTQARGVLSRGVQSMRKVLQTFSVNNRKNMFVIKESVAGNVFYLRLIESAVEASKTTEKFVVDEEAQLYHSNSELSLTGKKNQDAEDMTSLRDSSLNPDEEVAMTIGMRRGTSFASEKDFDQMSVSSRSTAYHSRVNSQDDTLTLVAHGIADVGEEISRDLVQMLQRKLNDAVLDVLSDNLTRNPMSKLTPEDVQYIQTPGSKPTQTIYLTVPASALLLQYALGFYLRQNLHRDSKLLFTPKYMDSSKAEGMFRDYTREGDPPIAENDVFLYNRPHQSRSKGLACLQLSMVDGRGQLVHLLGSPKPSCQAYKEPFNASLFEDCVDCKLTEPDHTIKVPGMTSLVSFQVWERGDTDVPQLTERLLHALRCATCDLVLEYRLLTAPVCEPPDVYSIVTPTQSAPPTPRMPPGAAVTQTADTDQSQSIETGGEKFTKDKPAFSFQAITEIFKGSSGLPGTPKHTQAEEKTWQELEVNRRKEAELQEMIDLYESGKRGVLTSIYSDLIFKWFDFCSNLGCPSVHVNHYELKRRGAVEFVLKEMNSIVANICSQTEVSIFQYSKSGYKPYTPCQKATSPSQVENSTADQDQGPLLTPKSQSKCQGHPLSTQGYVHSSAKVKGDTKARFEGHDNVDGDLDKSWIPGAYKTFVVIGRSMTQWRNSLQRGHDMTDSGVPQITKVSKNMQKFKPLEVMPSISKSAEKLDHVPSYGEQNYVPRQRYLTIKVVDKKITLYTYNWASEAINSLDRQLHKVVKWQNARLHLLNCLISQKMGLFQHHLYGEPLGESNQQKSEMDALIKNSTPVQIQSGGTRPGREAPPHLVHPASLQFDDLYRDSSPACLIHRGALQDLHDPVERHGLQMLQLRAVKRKERERIYVLEKFYWLWQRVGTSHLPVKRDFLELLKNSSRLVHTVSTPLMFCKQWRRNLSGDQPPRKNSGQDNKPRSRHGSGASIKSQRSGSIDSKKPLTLESPESSGTHSKIEPLKEEGWHKELRATFIQDYIQYIQSLGFYKINPQPSKHRPQASGGVDVKELGLKYTYLQKTLPAGIMLIEIGFSGVHFGVHVYALECSQLHHTVNSQLQLLFTDECDKFKDLTHVHSFTHDFHLRKMQAYMCNQKILKPGYHLTGFLRDFTNTFSNAPCFARNLIYEGKVQIDKISSPGSSLFKYMMDHKKVYNVRTIEMHPQAPFENETEYALVSQHSLSLEDESDLERVQINSENYLVGVVVAHDPPLGSAMFELETKSIHLRYWVILTNEKDIFPVFKLERKLGVVKTTSGQIFPARSSSACELDTSSPTSSRVEGVVPQLVREHHPAVKQELINYLGYSSTHQLPVYRCLMKEANKAQTRLQKMVSVAMVQCRRDMLWQRMLINTNLGEESALRRRHKSGWLASDNANDPLLQRLSCGEFEELLQIVCKEPLHTFDKSLMPLHNMPRSWYQALFKVLITKYGDYHRSFHNWDSSIQHLVIPNPKALDMFMLATIDTSGNRTDLCAVFRKQSCQDDAVTQSHVEAFVNTCCYHIWSCVL